MTSAREVPSGNPPTIRPVFRGMSPESVIRSVRSVFSLGSLRSNGSKRDGFQDLEDSNRKGSGSSTVGLKDRLKSGLDNKVTHPVPMKDMSPMPKDGMIVHKSFTMAEDTV